VAGHSHLRLPADEPSDFGAKTARLAKFAVIAAVAGLALAVVLGFVHGNYFRRFYFAYLFAFAYFLMLSLGALFFVLIQHVTRAGWSVNVRRVAENMAAQLPVLGVLSIPILLSVLLQKGDLYPWALPHHASTHEEAKGSHDPQPSASPGHPAPAKGHPEADATAPKGSGSPEEYHHELETKRGERHLDELMLKKRSWLNPMFWTLRVVFYFLVWTLLSLYYLKHSTQQDVDGDYRHTVLMQKWSGISIVLFALTATFASFDLFMSLDPHWYSTMFGVYYFASGVVTFFAALIFIVSRMQRAGYLREAVTVEHYHDMGKFLFAFVFFWGYVTFSQYMLLWYASIPETVTWLGRRGASTATDPLVPDVWKSWRYFAILLTIVCFLIPFPGLLSRHVKRNLKSISFWAGWLLVAQMLNAFWIVVPERRAGFPGWRQGLPVIELACLIGIGGVWLAGWLRYTARHRIRPVSDPRVFESAAFVNV
jgi:MFS family permease